MGLDVKTNGISPNLIKDCFMIHWFYINHFFIHQLMIPKSHSQNYIDASIKPKKKQKIGTKFGK
jgi:hypothetical protein